MTLCQPGVVLPVFYMEKSGVEMWTPRDKAIVPGRCWAGFCVKHVRGMRLDVSRLDVWVGRKSEKQ